MLTELYLQNYLMLQETRLPFDKGLTVITGETGAGKSILLGSISLIFGDNLPGIEAFDKEKPIYLEATFSIKDEILTNILAQDGIEKEDELIVAREISPNNRSTYFLNGRKVGVTLIKELKNYLLDFHHQRDQQRLLSSAYQLDLLDAYGGLFTLREDYANLYKEIKSDEKSARTEKHSRKAKTATRALSLSI